jgi:Leucine-rich repeat (LRR) protein
MVTVGTNFSQRSFTISYWPVGISLSKWLLKDDLRGTAIKDVPSSIQFLTSLCSLDMSGCSKLESLPEITVPMESLHSLKLSKTGIKEIPSSLIKHMISLITL